MFKKSKIKQTINKKATKPQTEQIKSSKSLINKPPIQTFQLKV
jgi:hypothetical protein